MSVWRIIGIVALVCALVMHDSVDRHWMFRLETAYFLAIGVVVGQVIRRGDPEEEGLMPAPLPEDERAPVD